MLNELTAEALAVGHELEQLEVRRPTLEDVYLELGRRGVGVTSPRPPAPFEQKIFWRSREAAVFIFVFPLLLYALLGSVYGDDIDGVPAVDVLLAGLFGYGAVNTAFGGLAIMLVIRREAGVLKRLARRRLLPAST